MARVAVSVNGRTYDLACEDGEEERLEALAGFVDEQVRLLAKRFGPVGEARLLLMTCLMLADHLDDSRTEIDDLRARDPAALPAEDALTADLDALAARIEDIAARLKPT